MDMTTTMHKPLIPYMCTKPITDIQMILNLFGARGEY